MLEPKIKTPTGLAELRCSLLVATGASTDLAALCPPSCWDGLQARLLPEKLRPGPAHADVTHCSVAETAMRGLRAGTSKLQAYVRNCEV